MAVVIEHKQYSKEHSSERSIQIFLNNQPMAVSQGTPENLSELAVGFLLSEGILTDREKFKSVSADLEKALVNVYSEESADKERKVMYRVTSSGCAQSALLTKKVRPEDVRTDITFKADDLLAMMEELCLMSPRRNNGECVHGCGIGNGGRLACVREDIGRHNAMDKLIGQAWLDQLPMHEMALFTTGRISYEMAMKASQSGVSVVVSRKSVTDSAIEIAEELGVTLVGKCRENSMQVLCNHHRVVE